MIIGIGIDVTELQRIEQSLARHGQRFLERVLTREEREYLPRNAVPFLAARFAAKEAGAKALGTGFSNGVGLHSFEVATRDTGKPEMRLLGKASEIALKMGATRVHVSLTHGRETAAAVVILEAD